jgi:hypothetical protein
MVLLVVEQKTTKVVVAICPACSIVIEHLAHLACLRIDSNVVRTEITMDRDMIIGGDGNPIMSNKNTIDLRQKACITYHVGQAPRIQSLGSGHGGRVGSHSTTSL